VLSFEVPGTSSENITESNEQLYIICVKIAINELKKIVMLSDLINKTVNKIGFSTTSVVEWLGCLPQSLKNWYLLLLH
jgi:hypothetical protein